MRQDYTEAEIKSKIVEIFAKAEAANSDVDAPDTITVMTYPNLIRIELSSMYEPPSMNFGIVKGISEYFETENINSDQFSWGGCETCDFGSSYGYTLTIEPQK